MNKEKYDEKFLSDITNIDFICIDDLYQKKEYIRENYCNLTGDYKRIYKWYYFFKLGNLKNPLKRLMWEYINGINNYIELCKEYRLFCDRRKRIIKKQMKEDYK